jgi:hypothetical protein
MKRRLFFLGLGLTVLVFALGGWTVDGLRWSLGFRPRAFA